jgi:hypothetical protein
MISNDDGIDASVYTTHELAYEALDNYVVEFWDTMFEDTDAMPDDVQTRVDIYFEKAQEALGKEESYDILDRPLVTEKEK